MQFHNLTLDKFQEDAVSLVDSESSVVVSAPTGSGKTLIADYTIDKYLAEDKRVIYTAPIKALSNQKFKDFVASYGEDAIGLITGDLVINPRAQVLIMTTEVYRNMAIMKDEVLDNVSYVIFDEIHFIGDYERGYVWEESIIFSPLHIRFLFLSATIPNSDEFSHWVERIKHHKVKVVRHDERPVPLKIAFFDPSLGITDLKSIRRQRELDRYPRYEEGNPRRGFRRQKLPQPKPSQLIRELEVEQKLPCIYFVFSRAKTQEHAGHLAKGQGFLRGEEYARATTTITHEFGRLSPEVKGMKTTKELRACLSKGVAFHHAGLLPDCKSIVEQLFGAGLVKVLFATETFAVGINMPAKTVCFDSLRKYTDTGFRYLNSKEFFQISGRAGRRGIDVEGLSVSVINRDFDDLKKIGEFTRKDDLPIRSQFRLSPNTVLNMMKRHTPDEIGTILAMNLFTFQALHGKGDPKKVLNTIQTRYDSLVKTLTRMDYVRDGELTGMGEFTTHIFSDEIEISQIFYGNTFQLDEYLTLVVLASLNYERRKEVAFYQQYRVKELQRLEKQIAAHPFLKRRKWHTHLLEMSSIITPCYEGKGFLEILKNTSMLEGDVIRLLMRILDKLEQIDNALVDQEKQHVIKNCKQLIRDCLKGIHLF